MQKKLLEAKETAWSKRNCLKQKKQLDAKETVWSKRNCLKQKKLFEAKETGETGHHGHSKDEAEYALPKQILLRLLINTRS